MGAALAAHHRVDLVDDHEACLRQSRAEALGGKENEERFRGGDQDGGRRADQGLAGGGQRVARPHGHADLGQAEPRLGRGCADTGERLAQVLLDVVVEGPERRDVDDVDAVFQSTIGGEAVQVIQRPEERGQRLPGAGGRDDQRIATGRDGVPALALGTGGLGKCCIEPASDERQKRRHRLIVRAGDFLTTSRRESRGAGDRSAERERRPWGRLSASVRSETAPYVTQLGRRRALRQRGRRKAEREAEGELPVGDAAREPPPDARVEPHVLRGPGLPDDTEERGIALVLTPRFLSVHLADEAHALRDRKLTDHSPDPDDVTGRPVDTGPAIEVEREGPELVAQDTDGLEPELPVALFGGRQKRPGFDREAKAVFVLEDTFLQHSLQEDPGVDDVHLAIGCPPDGELGHQLPVLEPSVVEDDPRDDEGVLVFRALEGEVADLDLDLFGIRDGGVCRDERPIGPRRRRCDEGEKEQAGRGRAHRHSRPVHRECPPARRRLPSRRSRQPDQKGRVSAVTGSWLLRIPRTAPPIMSLKAPTRNAIAATTVPTRIASARRSGTAAGESLTRETTSTPMTAGPMPFMTAFTQASCLTRSSTGRRDSMITNEGRNAAVAATAAPATPANL